MFLDPNPLWYGDHRPWWWWSLLLPLSWLYRALVVARRLAWRAGWFGTRRLPVPVIVIGNLTVGGTGKTPLVAWLARRLRDRGHVPGILVRGYGGRARHWPQVARPDSDPDAVGDEAVLLARHTGCVVVAGPDRAAAGALALQAGSCDLLLTDDGLQHPRLARDLEIAVIDGARGLGNGRCLPAGPLREPADRLKTVDQVIHNGGADRASGEGGNAGWMRLVPGAAVNLADPGRRRPLDDFRGMPIRAIAGIGHPERFFGMLRDLGLRVEQARPYPDHHRFTAADVAGWPVGSPVLMTEKDAVKCARLAAGRDDLWCVPVEAMLDPATERHLLARIAALTAPR